MDIVDIILERLSTIRKGIEIQLNEMAREIDNIKSDLEEIQSAFDDLKEVIKDEDR
jgi:predicted  nucleic acid-binding Zn-ribbon protein